MNIRLTTEQKIRILNSQDIFSIMKRVLMRENKIDRNREHFWVIGLANDNAVLYVELVSMGSINSTVVEPMEVFSFALQKRTVKIILVHNHPSGTMEPSKEDMELTDRLIQVGRIVHCPVLDHLIISTKEYYSFEASGLLDKLKKSKAWVPPYEEEERLRQKVAAIERRNRSEEIARGMKADGVPMETIMKYTGLTEAEVGKL